MEIYFAILDIFFILLSFISKNEFESKGIRRDALLVMQFTKLFSSKNGLMPRLVVSTSGSSGTIQGYYLRQ